MRFNLLEGILHEPEWFKSTQLGFTKGQANEIAINLPFQQQKTMALSLRYAHFHEKEKIAIFQSPTTNQKDKDYLF